MRGQNETRSPIVYSRSTRAVGRYGDRCREGRVAALLCAGPWISGRKLQHHCAGCWTRVYEIGYELRFFPFLCFLSLMSSDWLSATQRTVHGIPEARLSGLLLSRP